MIKNKYYGLSGEPTYEDWSCWFLCRSALWITLKHYSSLHSTYVSKESSVLSELAVAANKIFEGGSNCEPPAKVETLFTVSTGAATNIFNKYFVTEKSNDKDMSAIISLKLKVMSSNCLYCLTNSPNVQFIVIKEKRML